MQITENANYLPHVRKDTLRRQVAVVWRLDAMGFPGILGIFQIGGNLKFVLGNE